MRVLFISNFYPPAQRGGKEIRCSEVATRLQARGHACRILASDYAPAAIDIPPDSNIKRSLTLEADLNHYQPIDHLLHQHSRLRHSQQTVEEELAAFQPDVVFVWGMWNMSPSIAATAERLLPQRVIYSFGDYWPTDLDPHERYWRHPGGGVLGRLFCWVLAPLALSSYYRPVPARSLAFAHAVTCSRYVLEKLRSAGLALPHAKVVFSGIDLSQFSPAVSAPPQRAGDLNVIYAGELTARKGVTTALEALRLLGESGDRGVKLTLAGEGHPEYRAYLEGLAAQAGLNDRVCFRSAVPRREMPGLLQQFDALILPSGREVPEPLARIVMEAMACGLVTIGTECGGTPEMIEHGVDGLLFAPDDSRMLAEHLRRAASDLTLRRSLSTAARRKAETRFDIKRMIDDMESFLQEVVEHAQRV